MNLASFALRVALYGKGALAMVRVPVESSQIKSVGYEAVDATSGVLEVEFSTGAIYTYANVPPGLHSAFMEAESKGKFFGKQIKSKPAMYPFQKVREATKKEKAE